MRAFITTWLAALASCATGAKKPMTELPTCASMTECVAHDHQRVVVVATYQVWDPLPERARDQPPAQQVRLVFASGEEGPFLGAWGRDGHERSLKEIASFSGKKVRVVGTFLRDMPPHPTDPPHAASLGGPCVHPVEKVELAP